MSKPKRPSRFCVVFVPKPDKCTGVSKHPSYVFRGPLPVVSPDGLMDKCNPNLLTQINNSKGQIVFGNENQIDLNKGVIDENAPRVEWNGASNSGSLGTFVKEHAANYFFAQVAAG